MIRISASSLEAFRRWQAKEESPTQEMVDYLLRITPPTEAMLAGTAWHKILENACYGDELSIVEQDGFKFNLTELVDEIALPVIRECKIEIPHVISGEPVVFVGVVDAMTAGEIFDHKLTSNDTVENYTDSMQWRCYLDWFGADKFTYNLFKSYKPANKDFIQIKSLTQFSFNSYPKMKDDIEKISVQFVDFVKNYVPELVKNG